MAYKNDGDLSDFSNRLLGLMEEHQIPSANKLAQELWDKKLIKVNSRKQKKDGKEQEREVDAITKRVQDHLKAESAKSLQGEYALAYSDLFGVSLDYLFMKSDVKSPDPDIQRICQQTGLSESTANRLVEASGNNKSKVLVEFWDTMLDSELFNELPGHYKNALLVKGGFIDDDKSSKRLIRELEQCKSEVEREEIESQLISLNRKIEIDDMAVKGVMHEVAYQIVRFLENNRQTKEIMEKIGSNLEWTYSGPRDDNAENESEQLPLVSLAKVLENQAFDILSPIFYTYSNGVRPDILAIDYGKSYFEWISGKVDFTVFVHFPDDRMITVNLGFTPEFDMNGNPIKSYQVVNLSVAEEDE